MIKLIARILHHTRADGLEFLMTVSEPKVGDLYTIGIQNGRGQGIEIDSVILDQLVEAKMEIALELELRKSPNPPNQIQIVD